jgi:UDP-N-acetylmuramate: L-alanyl-gamma-D-glutamyl-meso-diaminopimelate ligase
MKKKKLHVIGISGAGTSAVALLMKGSGWEISGSDSGMYEPIASYLKKQNIVCKTPYHKNNIPNDVDMILLGSSATLNAKNNEEVAKALQLDVPIKSFAEILHDLTKDTHNVVVAGSYGKSTITSLLSYVLVDNKKDPHYFIGAIPINLKKSSHVGSGDYFIIEGDEYPHKIDDITSKFLFYNAKSIILSSCEHDHINKFPTLESYLTPYKKLIQGLQKEDILVCAINNPNVREVASHSKAKIITYGFENSDYVAKNIKYGLLTTFDVYKNNNFIASFETQLLGKHNIENILAVISLVLEKNILSIKELQKSIPLFKGLKRRLDKKTEKSIIPVYEGFGSSYTKAKTAIEAIKLHFPEKKLFIIFEPHTFGWRNRANLKWYHDVFDGANTVFIYKPPTHGAESHEQLSQKEIIDEIKKYQDNVVAVSNSQETLEFLKNQIDGNSIILLLSSGDLGGMVKDIPNFFEENFLS